MRREILAATAVAAVVSALVSVLVSAATVVVLGGGWRRASARTVEAPADAAAPLEQKGQAPSPAGPPVAKPAAVAQEAPATVPASGAVLARSPAAPAAASPPTALVAPVAAGAAVPLPAVTRCERTEDLLLPLAYADGGRVFIPREVPCDGEAEVVILLHGNQDDRDPAPALGGGRRQERLVRALLDEQRIQPVILAEPVHFASCGPSTSSLYRDGFSFAEYQTQLERLLGQQRVRPRSYSVVGHSASGCCPDGGLFRAAESLRPLKLLVTSDSCYHATVVQRLLGLLGDRLGLVNTSRGEPHRPGYERFEAEVLTGRARSFQCDRARYRRCLRHPERPWFSFTTRRGDLAFHSETGRLALRNALELFFSGRPFPGDRPAPGLATAGR